MYHYKLDLDKETYDTFIEQQPLVTVFQSSNWAQVKEEWGNVRLGIYQDDRLVAAASLLIRPLLLGRTMIYIPRGPILDYQDQDLLAYVLKTLKRLAKTYKAIFIKFDPFIQRQVQAGGQRTENPLAQNTIDSLQKLGCDWLGLTTDITENVQPRFQANLYATDFSESHFSKRVRQELRTARNKGIDIQYGGPELVDDFTALMKKTEARKQIHLRGRDYYLKILNTYPGQSYITMASLDLAVRRKNLDQQLEKAQTHLASLGENGRQSKIDQAQKEIDRLVKEIDFLSEKLKEGRTVIPLAATLSVEFAHTSENIYAGMDDDYRQYQAPLLTWFETAKHAFERGNRWQNMGGVENSLDGGLYTFKARLNPHIEEYIGEFNLPTSPFYRLTNLAYTIRKKVRSRKS
ncbi:aminoacyltransferase [Streptococcus sp. DD13]|uniref:aminoacyltransferase n=1 Tax=Streptococcus sp. DD13 TaxID=1777881 RepID=UPI0007999AA8|nr:aminoacyltransferase [Streptococcus sp. DD13]KXT78571.1 tRNA-dependent lipid II--L-alanine ligase [Streptococcus sp. DD13]